MAEPTREHVTVTFSPQSSVAYFLKRVLDCAGFGVAAALSNQDELESVIHRHRPDAIVYDVSFPFAENWQALQDLRRRSTFHQIPVIVTTSESRQLFRATGCSSAIEIFARPDDVTALQEALRGAIQAVAPVHAV